MTTSLGVCSAASAAGDSAAAAAASAAGAGAAAAAAAASSVSSTRPFGSMIALPPRHHANCLCLCCCVKFVTQQLIAWCKLLWLA